MARMQRGAVGDDRWNALWGRGGRGMLAAALAIVALALPVGAYANDGDGEGTADGTYVNADVVTQAEASPNEPVRVIVQSREDSDAARDAVEEAID
jgi:hypothetical protein